MVESPVTQFICHNQLDRPAFAIHGRPLLTTNCRLDTTIPSDINCSCTSVSSCANANAGLMADDRSKEAASNLMPIKLVSNRNHCARYCCPPKGKIRQVEVTGLK